MTSDYDIVDILRNSRIVKGVSAGITTLATLAAFTFGSVPAANAAPKHNAPNQTLEQIATDDLPLVPLVADSQVPEDDFAPVPLVDPEELKKKEKKKDKQELAEDAKKISEESDALPIVPLVTPTIKKHKLRLPKPFSAFEIQPVVINVVNGEFNPKRGRYTGRLDLNKDGTLDYTLFMERGDKPDTFQVWLGEIATSKPIDAQTVKVHKELGKIIAGWPGTGTRNFYVMGEYSTDPVFSISNVRGIESILLPDSIAEAKVRGYDKIDDRIACHLKKGCMLIQNVPDSKLIKIRQMQVKQYFAEAKEIIEEDIIKTRDGAFHRGELYSKTDYETYILHLADEAMRRFEIYNKIIGDAPISRLAQIACEKYVQAEKEKMLAWIENYAASDAELAKKRAELEEKAKQAEKKPDEKPDTYVRKNKEPEHKIITAIKEPVIEIPDVEVAQIQDEPKRFYETWWFWTIVGAVVTGAAVTGAVLGTQGGDGSPKPNPALIPGDGHYIGRF